METNSGVNQQARQQSRLKFKALSINVNLMTNTTAVKHWCVNNKGHTASTWNVRMVLTINVKCPCLTLTASPNKTQENHLKNSKWTYSKWGPSNYDEVMQSIIN